MKNSLLLLFSFCLLLSSCSHKLYTNAAYLKQHSIAGKKVAILPVKVIFTGKLPTTMSEADKVNLENAESLALQTQLYHELIFRSGKRTSKKSPVSFMEVSVINSRLQAAGINLADATTADVEALAQILGADMVVRTQVRKNRFTSDLASLGIGTAVNMANILLGGTTAPYIFGSSSLNKTYDIFYDLNLYDAQNKVSISKYSRTVEADWNDSPEEIFRENARFFAKRAPVKTE
jgi:hypothetical protein